MGGGSDGGSARGGGNGGKCLVFNWISIDLLFLKGDIVKEELVSS